MELCLLPKILEKNVQSSEVLLMVSDAADVAI